MAEGAAEKPQVLMQHPRHADPVSSALNDDRPDPLPSSPPTGALVVLGFSSTLHPITADNIAAVNAFEHLLPCFDETVDRYDVRLLLDEPTAGRSSVGGDDTELQANNDSDASIDERVQLLAEEDKARLREAPLRDENSSGEWQMANLEWERYRDLDSDHSDDESEENDTAAPASDRRAGKQWHYNYSSEKPQQTKPRKRRRETEQGVIDDDADDTLPPQTPPKPMRPTSPPAPPFEPSFRVPLNVQLVRLSCTIQHLLHSLLQPCH